MRNLVVVMVLILIPTSAVYAGEPESGQLNVTAGGGINMQSGEDASNGFVVGGGLGYHASSRLVLGAEISYLGYGKEEGTTETIGGPIDYSMDQHFFSYMGTAKFFLAAKKTSPYVKGFAGRFDYTFNSVIGDLPLDYTYSDIQYGGGLGMLFRGGKESNFYLEALINRLQGEDSAGEIYTFTMGMDFNFTL